MSTTPIVDAHQHVGDLAHSLSFDGHDPPAEVTVAADASARVAFMDAVGIDWAVPKMAMASVACGADGVMVEVHPDPRRALSDGQQSLTCEAYLSLAADMLALHQWQSARK